MPRERKKGWHESCLSQVHHTMAFYWDFPGSNGLFCACLSLVLPSRLRFKPNVLDTCLLRNLYVGQEATVRTRHGKMDGFRIGKGVRQGCILSPCSFSLYAKYIMPNATVDESQAGIKAVGWNINNLRYADDTTLRAENQEEFKALLMKVKEKSEKPGLKLNIPKTKIMASGPITSWQIDGKNGNRDRLYFPGLQNHCGQWLQPWN